MGEVSKQLFHCGFIVFALVDSLNFGYRVVGKVSSLSSITILIQRQN